MATSKRRGPWLLRPVSALTTTLAAFLFGLAGGVAQAAPAPAPSTHWCPGDPWDPGWDDIYNWNWTQCHDWQGQGRPMASGPWGPPPGWASPRPPQPSWAPGAQLMWNPLYQGWGFWNNGIWTPI